MLLRPSSGTDGRAWSLGSWYRIRYKSRTNGLWAAAESRVQVHGVVSKQGNAECKVCSRVVRKWRYLSTLYWISNSNLACKTFVSGRVFNVSRIRKKRAQGKLLMPVEVDLSVSYQCSLSFITSDSARCGMATGTRRHKARGPLRRSIGTYLLLKSMSGDQ